ncbi:C10 family peptidase [Apibacter sp. HY039]|uniref:C10 family peptidase n=1 Tax=Apibacter sp. HY039 TaxID=2501476 RepID=UPI000FEB742A|nr:C10 family peptidase [Apibacter sp. HY039]
MNNYKYIIIVMGILIPYLFHGQDVSEKTAEYVAKNFLIFKSEKHKSGNIGLTNVTDQLDKKYDGFYIFKNTDGNGFIIISSESENHPVLAYSLDSPITLDQSISPELLYILNNYQLANEYLRKNKAQKVINQENSLIEEEWKALLTGKALPLAKSSNVSLASNVDPLLKTIWNQYPYYNKLAPVTYEGKSSLTGCVATAMAQIMKFWNYPDKGSGSHTYTIANNFYNWKGKTLTANFQNTNYQWNHMPNFLSSSSSAQQVDAVATLMYHAGVSVNMIYGPSASGAFDANVVPALKNYFKYSPSAEIKYRSNYTSNAEWLNLVKDQLTKNYPVYFMGRSSSGGHAFVADGYDSNNLIHFNLGWGGKANGYYQITNPQGFTNNQAVIINIFPPVPTCSAPDDLSITYINGSGAILNWKAVNGAKNYTVEYKMESEDNWIATTIENTATSFTLSKLNAGTSYLCRIKTNCYNSSSSIYKQNSFTTRNCPFTTGLNVSNISDTSALLSWNPGNRVNKYSIEFKAYSDTIWTRAYTTSNSFELKGLQTNTSYDWRVNTYCDMRMNSGYSQSSFVTSGGCISPSGLNTTNISTNKATLNWNLVNGAVNYIVEYKSLSDTNWNTARTTSNVYTISGLEENTSYSWRIKANCTTSSSSAYSQSNFNTSGTCINPSGLNTNNISKNSATVNWEQVSGAFRYKVEYKNDTLTNWVTATVTTDNSFTFTGLEPNTFYNWRVITYCSPSISSGFSQSVFRTASDCSAPSGLRVINITNNSASLNWNPIAGVYKYKVEYKAAYDTIWIMVRTKSNAFTISGLKENTSYTWRVKTYCSTSSTSAYSQSDFITPETCITPSDLSETNISSNSAKLSWLSVNGAYRYKVEFKPTNTSFWTTAAVTANNYASLTGLLPDVSYDWRVTTYCSPSVQSRYAQSSFRTNLSSTNDITFGDTLSSSVSLHPNPVEDIIYIKGIKVEGSKNIIATIIDRNGKIVKTFAIKPDKEICLDVSELTSNVYFLRIKEQTLKFIKK